VQVRGLQTASDDPEPSLITSKWHIYGTSHGTSCWICGKLPRIGVLRRMFSQGSDGIRHRHLATLGALAGACRTSRRSMTSVEAPGCPAIPTSC